MHFPGIWCSLHKEIHSKRKIFLVTGLYLWRNRGFFLGSTRRTTYYHVRTIIIICEKNIFRRIAINLNNVWMGYQRESYYRMSSVSSESAFILPDILAEWPWKRTMNPHLSHEMKAESSEWIHRFVSTPHMQQVISSGDFSEFHFAVLLCNDSVH